MPLYEYKCKPCGAVFELLRSRSERDDPTPCASCRRAGARRIMSTFAGRVGGSGSESASVAGSGGCAGCGASSCAGCRH